MIDKKMFATIRKDMLAFTEKREEVIAKSRDIIALSKQIIGSVHRNAPNKALITEIKTKLKSLPNHDYDTGMARVARQEYVEAICFYEFTVNHKLPSYKQLGVDADSYLLGLCDLTGELMRKSVNSAINKDFATVLRIKEFVTDLYDEFMKFDLRNGELRKKFDEIKWNLKKIEDIAYDIKMKGLA